MVENPNELSPVKVEAIEKETKSFTCPHCNTHLQFLVRVQVVGVHETLAGDEHEAVKARKPIPKKAEPAPIEFVEQAKRDGIFGAFAKTIVSTPHNVPTDVEKYFLTFLKRATKIRAPQFAIRLCLPEDERAGDLELWAFQNIAGVVAAGAFANTGI